MTTNDEFKRRALPLFRAGYRVVPIPLGGKRVVLEGWPTWADTQDEKQVKKLVAKANGCGVGILAKWAPGVDLDVRLGELAQRLAGVAHEMLGWTVERIGMPPKLLLPYRTATPFKKQVLEFTLPDDQPGDKTHKVEVLGDGQQWVAYHTHPDTGRPYLWPEGELPPWEALPEITAEQLHVFLQQCRAIFVQEFGGTIVNEPAQAREEARPNAEQRGEISEVASALRAIPNKDDYDQWIDVGMALKGALSEAGWPLFARWSAVSPRDNPVETAKKWASFKPREIGATKIFYLARQYGWERKPGQAAGEEELKRQQRGNGQDGQPGDGASLAPGLQRIGAVTPKPIDWNWYPYLPAGQIVILGGSGGVGKGLVATALAARISKAAPWPTTDIQANKGIVIWGETEDPLAQVVRPRLDAAEADVNEVHYCKPADFLQLDLKALIRNHALRLIVLSPMVSFLRGLSGLNEELEVRSILEKLQADIEDTSCTVLGLCHTNKKPDLRAIERLLGSVAFTNFVRSVLLVAPDKDEAGWVRLAHAKHNLSIRGDDLLYRAIHTGPNPQDQNVALEWKRPEGGNVETDTMFERKKADANGHDNRRPPAAQWLVAYLRENGKSLRAQVFEAGEKAGHSEAALCKAHGRNDRLHWEQAPHQGPVSWWHE